MSEQVLQSGTLGEPVFLELLMAARRAPFPVVLKVARTPEHVRSFYFRDGRITGFSTTGAAEDLAAMLVKRKRLSPSSAQDVQRSAQAERVPSEVIIQRLRLMPGAALDREMSLWATLLLVQTFAWETGNYTLSSSTSSGALPAAIDVEIASAMKSGVFKKVPPARARADLATGATNLVRYTKDAPIPLLAFGLTGEQEAFASALDGSRPLAEVLASGELEADELARTLYLLVHTELVALVPAAEESTDLGEFLEDFGEDDGDGFASVAPVSRPADATAAGAIDFSQISFGASSGRGRSTTTHTSTSHLREEVATTTGRANVQVVTGSAPALQGDFEASKPKAAPPPQEAAAGGGLGDDLFAGLGDSGRRSAPTPTPDPSASASTSAPPSRGPAIDLPPEGPGFTIEQAEWNRLPTKDKNRIKELATRLIEMEDQNYFQWLDLPDEAPLMSVKKAFFKLAQRFHPDRMIDEPPVYARVSEVVFTKISEAYETLGDEEASSAYVKKHLYGEKDENDLAMEQVQKILAAEGEFKRGQRMLNAGKLMGALTSFKAATEGYPEEGEYAAYYGYVLFRVKQKSDPNEAQSGIERILKGIEMSPAATAPPHLLGKCYILMGDGSAAKKAIRTSLKMNADNPEALRDYKRADALSKGEDPDARPGAENKKGIKKLFGRFKKGK